MMVDTGNRIGDVWPSKEGNQVWAGDFGWVSEEEYNQHLQSGAVARGQQEFEGLLRGAVGVYNKVGEYIPDIELNQDTKENLSTAKDIAGHVYNWTLRPTVDPALTVLGFPVEAAHYISKKVDPTGRGIGKGPLGLFETVVTAGGPTLLKGGKAALGATDDLLRAASRADQLVPVGVNDGLLSTAANVAQQTDGPLVSNVFAFTKQQRTPAQLQLIKASRQFKPKGFNTNKWDNFITKFGSREGAEAAIKKAEESAKYLKKHGSLKGNNNIWTDPKTGESFLVKNKAKRGEISIGFDSLKSIETTLAKRLKGAKLNTKEIERIGKGLGWDDVKIQKYIETNEQAKRTLEALIKDLNKAEGRTMWSLGHRTAVKHLPHSADRALNIELEPLVDVLTKEGRKISGNTGRAANDELIDLFKKITNNPVDLKSDMIHWGDSLVGNLMPRMREINNADDFFKEIVKREDYLAKINAYAKKNKVSLDEAADVIMLPLMKKTLTNQPTYFD